MTRPPEPGNGPHPDDGTLERREAALHQGRSNTDEVLPLVEERITVGKRVVERGRVRVSTRTEMVEEHIRQTLRGDTVDVQRVPIDRTLAEGETLPVARTEGDVTVIPVLEEVLVVEKRLVLKEELRIRRITSGQDVELPITRRVQIAVIERLAPEGQDPANVDPPTDEELIR